MRILIIEDESSLLNALKKGFEKHYYAVDTALDGEAALERYYEAYYDIVVLDLNLPKVDGLDVLKAIREENSNINIIILSARNTVEDKISGLDMGANDYLEKPFSFKELLARVRALSRRKYRTEDTVLKAHGITLHLARREVYYNDESVPLTKKGFGILEYLLLNQGEVVSGEALIEHVWNHEADMFSNAFKVHLSSLRKKLPKDVIRTVRGEGYYVP